MKQEEPPKYAAFQVAPDPILWKDRKRILGMPISFTRYENDTERLTTRTGFFRTITNDILLYRILDLILSRSLWQKLFDVGTIMLYTAVHSDIQCPLVIIKRPEKVRRFLSKIIEKERNDRRLTGRELFGVAGAGMTDIDGDGVPD